MHYVMSKEKYHRLERQNDRRVSIFALQEAKKRYSLLPTVAKRYDRAVYHAYMSAYNDRRGIRVI